MEIMQERGIAVTKITAILIMGNGDRYEKDGISPFTTIWNAFPAREVGRGGIWRWADRAWEIDIQTKPKVGDMEFKIGDRVKMKAPDGRYNQPTGVGTVSALPTGAAAAFVIVDFDGGPQGYAVLYSHLVMA